ncbi:hypothetical protein [Aquimarina mytili]|uniref:Uncharacterized protein n=1 Tax=Aquimarina mytili TaxID=874423 RepID=A0A937DC65_9FLAO|nr:hypothetical protein [Aquimarina mytili]MBL0685318.1 hypothetical protein [Aquimarina mytili]
MYINIKNELDIQNRLENAVNEIQSQIARDFKGLFGHELILKEFQIHVDDENYRQSSTGLILNEVILGNENFEITVECLIDHGKIWVKVKDGKEIPGFNLIVKRIESAQNFEGLTELKEIK